jgi:hypothetical protein
MKLYLDDERETPEGWTRVYTAYGAILALQTGEITEVSLDHDLGTEEDGYDVAQWIEISAWDETLKRLKWNVHSANPAGASRMRAALMSADKYWDYTDMKRLAEKEDREYNDNMSR